MRGRGEKEQRLIAGGRPLILRGRGDQKGTA
jgi:hypothetical protein